MTAAASLIRSGRQGGFTYLSVVILVAIIGLVSAATLRLGVAIQRVQAEEELLRIGAEYSDALASYAAATPPGQPTYPPSLKELLKDPRFPQVRRHLRRIYIDPMTGKAEWGLIRAGINKPGTPGALGTPGAPGAAPGTQAGAFGAQNGPPGAGASPFGAPPASSALNASEGGIIGIYSLSTAQPIKIGNFPQRFVSFEGKASVSDWKFTVETAQVPATAAGKPGPVVPPPPQQPGTPPLVPASPMTSQPPKPEQQEPAAQPETPPQEPQQQEPPPEKAEPTPPPSEPEEGKSESGR